MDSIKGDSGARPTIYEKDGKFFILSHDGAVLKTVEGDDIVDCPFESREMAQDWIDGGIGGR